MLNLCLKRMCARVITSLSALGVVSIAGTTGAEAANYSSTTTYKNGDSFTYTPTKGLTFTAQYNKKNGSCSTSGSTGVMKGTYSANTANTIGYCAFVCQAGMFHNSGSSANPMWAGGFTVTGVAGSTIYAGSGVCQWVKPSCAAVANATVVSAGGGTTQIGTCNYTCKAGYHVNGKSQSVTTFSEVGTGMTSPTMQLPTTGTCVANTYTVTFDCTTSGLISGTSSQTATKSATYGQSFSVDKSCTPKTTAWTFTGWKGN